MGLSDIIRNTVLTGVAAASLASYAPKADAAEMDLANYSQIGSTFIYEFENISDDGAANNGLDFTISAGTNQGIIGANSDIDGDAWNVSILDNLTIFDYNNGNFAAWAPGEVAVFELNVNPLYSALGTESGLASATARGSVEPIPFNDIQIQVPGTIPTGLANPGSVFDNNLTVDWQYGAQDDALDGHAMLTLTNNSSDMLTDVMIPIYDLISVGDLEEATTTYDAQTDILHLYCDIAPGQEVVLDVSFDPTYKDLEEGSLDYVNGSAHVLNGFASVALDSERILGDINGDGGVGAEDLDIILANWGTGSTYSAGDLTGDGTVGTSDLNQVLNNWGQYNTPGGVQVPEPGSLLLLGLSGLALYRGRERR